MREELIKDQRFSWAERAVIAYHQSFDKGKRCFASDSHISEKLGIPKRTVENLHTSIRKKTGLKGRNFSESALETTRNCVVTLHDLQRIDKRVDKRPLKTKEETTQKRVVLPDIPKKDYTGCAAAWRDAEIEFARTHKPISAEELAAIVA